MNQTALEFVEEYLKKEAGEYYKTNGFDECFAELIGWESIYEEHISPHRWWDDLFCVVNINGTLIGYEWASTTGDNNIFDVGWTFDKSSICYVKKEEVIITKYVKIKE